MNSQLVAPDPNKLTREEIDHFHFQGFLGPYPSFTPEAMKTFSEDLHGDVFKTAGPNPTKGIEATHSRHLDSPLVYSMVSHPAIVQRICSLLGEDLMLWTSGFWIKEPHGKGLETPWHQDINYWPLEPQVNITCWIAIEEVTAENAPLRVIPGSHRHLVPHLNVAGKALGAEADPKHVDETKAKTLIMKPGEFVLFSEKLLHGSHANTSSRQRCALAARYTTPLVRLFPKESPINFPGYQALMVSGRDQFHWNPIGSPPLG
jgi:ectoine hydroxylase-related dioxygenase (phytanoyl-CoA dioxygenase family)